jgi:hypothetical protein
VIVIGEVRFSHRLRNILVRLMHGQSMHEHPVMLQLKALDITATSIDSPLCVRRIEPGRTHTLQVLHLQRQEQSRPLYENFKLSDDVHGCSLSADDVEER